MLLRSSMIDIVVGSAERRGKRFGVIEC